MIKVTIGTSSKRQDVIINPNTTLRQALETNNINYATAQVTLDGCPLNAGEIDNTFADMGVTEKCFLIAVVKADNNR